MSGGHLAVLVAAAALSLPAPAGDDVRAQEPAAAATPGVAIPPEAAAELARLRALWGGVAEAEIVEGSRIEYVPYTGRILLGDEALAKLAAGVDNVGGAAMRFLLGHEAWHSVQWSRQPREEWRRKRENRTLECEADFMAAAEGYRAAERSGMDATARQAALEGIERYVRGNSTGAGYSPRYPSPEMRSTTIKMGWHHAGSPGLIRRSGGGSTGETDSALAEWACRRIAGVNDASVGGLRLDWSDARDEPGGSRTQLLKASNSGRRPITFSFLLIGLQQWRSGGDGGERPPHERIYQVIEDEVTLAPGAAAEKRYVFDAPPSRAARDPESYDWVFVTRPYAYASGNSSLISARYADAPAQLGFCYDKAAKLPRSGDRILLARLATIALAAQEDFHPIAGREVSERTIGREVVIAGGLGEVEGFDVLRVDSDRADVSVTAFQGDRAGAEAEFERLLASFASLCGKAALDDVVPVGEGGSKVVRIYRLAPYATVTMHLGVYDRLSTPDTKDGSVFFVIRRNSGW